MTISTSIKGDQKGIIRNIANTLFNSRQRLLFRQALRWHWIPIDAVYCFCQGLPYSLDWDLRGYPVLVRGCGAKIQIGRRWKAISRLTANSLGVNQPVYINIGPNGRVLIGDDVGMSGCSISAKESIIIGDRVLVGTGVLITDNDAHPLHPDKRGDYSLVRKAAVIIASDVFIGARAIILKGVSIGTGAVIGAGAIVSRSVPEYAIVAGNPAQQIGDSRKA